MITFAKDKADGFTQEYADQFKHTCGTCFSNGPVDVGLTATVNGKLMYTCAKCVVEQAKIKVWEECEQTMKFLTRWMGGDLA